MVIVVGGGPAGSSTAFFLARQGVDVLVLDRARFPRDKTCSEYLSPQASRILASMDVLSEIESAGAAQLAGMRVHAPNGATIHGEFSSDHGFKAYRDHGIALRRTLLDTILLERARSAGARVQEGIRVTDVMRDSRGTIIGVKAIEEDGTPIEIESDLVVGADGLRSVVARRLGLLRPSRWPRRVALVAHFAGVEGAERFGEMHVDREGYFGVAKVGDGIFNVAIVVPVARGAEIAADRAEFFESWIAERPKIAEMFRHAERIDEVRATGPFATAAKRAWVPGAALVGDAAEFFDPFTGEGIYTALRGGELLAFHAGRAIDSASHQQIVLESYEKARRNEFAGKWRVEKLVGAAIAFTPFLNRAASVLSRRRDMADLLVGVVGDFVPAREVLRPGYLLSLLFSPARA